MAAAGAAMRIPKRPPAKISAAERVDPAVAELGKKDRQMAQRGRAGGQSRGAHEPQFERPKRRIAPEVSDRARFRGPAHRRPRARPRAAASRSKLLRRQVESISVAISPAGRRVSAPVCRKALCLGRLWAFGRPRAIRADLSGLPAWPLCDSPDSSLTASPPRGRQASLRRSARRRPVSDSGEDPLVGSAQVVDRVDRGRDRERAERRHRIGGRRGFRQEPEAEEQAHRPEHDKAE